MITKISSTILVQNDLDEVILEKQRVKDPGTLQRERTAWTTGIGHDRVTPGELQHRYLTRCIFLDLTKVLPFIAIVHFV